MTTNKKRYFAQVDVSDEVHALAGAQVGVMITHLRSSGADCWHCLREIRRSHRASLVLELTADGMRSGFVHAPAVPLSSRTCAPTGGPPSVPIGGWRT
jgi:hypothetical protein